MLGHSRPTSSAPRRKTLSQLLQLALVISAVVSPGAPAQGAASGCDMLGDYARLACYERRAAIAVLNDSQAGQACMREPAALNRLRCFDGLARPADQQLSRRDRQAPVSTASAPTQGTETQAPPPDAAQEGTDRLEVLIGPGVGTHSGTFLVELGDQESEVDLVDVLGGAGASIRLAWWRDRQWCRGRCSIGAEYFWMANEAEASVKIPAGLVVPTGNGITLADPTTAVARAKLRVHNLAFNVAYSPSASLDDPAPYAGLGLGVAIGNLETTAELRSAFLGDMGISGNTPIYAPLVQGFVGVDWPLYRSLYLTTRGTATYYDGRLFGVEHRFLQMFLGAGVGVRF